MRIISVLHFPVLSVWWCFAFHRGCVSQTPTASNSKAQGRGTARTLGCRITPRLLPNPNGVFHTALPPIRPSAARGFLFRSEPLIVCVLGICAEKH